MSVQTGVNVAAETARKAAQLNWAMEQLGGVPNKVVVVPHFVWDKKNKEWTASTDIIRQGANKEWGSLLLMSYPGSGGRERWQTQTWALAGTSAPFLLTALVPLPTAKFEDYAAGQLLDGRIDTVYTTTPTNPNNLDQDKWYYNRAAVNLDMCCEDADGNTLYQKRYFEDDLSYPVPIRPVPGNLTDLLIATGAKNVATSNTGKEVVKK